MKRIFKLNKLILFIAVLYSTLSFSQESFKFKDISRHSIKVLKEGVVTVPDYDAEYRRPMYDGTYNKAVEEFIIAYENISKQLKDVDTLDKKKRRKKRKELKSEKENILNKFKPVFDVLKRKNMGMIHFRGVEFASSNFLDSVKKELGKLKGKIVPLERLSERELFSKVPTKTLKLKYLVPVDITSEIRGEYIIEGEIKVSNENSIKNKLHRGQVIEKVIDNGDYSIYKHFKSVDGSGMNFYNSTIDVYNEYTVERKPKPLSKKNIEIKRKVKLYLKQADPYLKKMYNGILAKKNWTLTKGKRAVWVNATKQVKIIDKKIRALYRNDSKDKYDNRYDFIKLLETKTVEDLTYFDTVLSNSKQMLGLH